MSQLAKRNTTHARLSFYTHSVINNKIDVFDVFDLPGITGRKKTSLISFTFGDGIEAPFGSVTFMLKARKESFDFFYRQGKLWTELLEQGDWWKVEIYKNDQVVELSFGIIDAVGHLVSAGGGAVETVIQVSGRSYGFALTDTPVFFNPYDVTIDQAAGINMTQILQQCAGSPDSIVKTIIRGFMGGINKPLLLGGYIEVPLGLSVGPLPQKWIAFLDDSSVLVGGGVQDELRGITLITNLINPSSGGSVWDMVKSWSNPVLNEVFIDSSPLRSLLGPKVKLIMREKPFVNLVDNKLSPWFKLTTWEVDARLVEQLSLTKGANRINYVMLTGDLAPVLQQNALGVYLPVSNGSSVDKYGLKRIEESTIYFDGEAAQVAGQLKPQPPMSIAYREQLFLLVCWNMLNHRYWSGTITIGEMRPEIRKGEKIRLSNAYLAELPGFPRDLLLKGLDMTFYVESVQHNWSEGDGSPTSNTVLTVSRGYQEDLRLVAMAEEAVDWSLITTIPSGSADAAAAKLGLLDQIQQLQIDKFINLTVPDPIISLGGRVIG